MKRSATDRSVSWAVTVVTPALLAVAAAFAGSPPAMPEELLDALRNTTYPSQWTRSGRVPLADGRYEEPVVPESASRLVVRLNVFIAAGTIDGQPAAAVVVETDPVGSGVFFDLHLLRQLGNRWSVVDHVFLGDRIRVSNIEFAQDHIHLDLITHGPHDALCCPTKAGRIRFALIDGRLAEIQPPAEASGPR
jgi:hypothetical protein